MNLTLITEKPKMQQLKIILEPWENRIILLIFMIFAILIGLSFFGHFAIAEKAQNLTGAQMHLSSVGVDALAGVLAIVISVTLMAVQFSSQEYTQRIMDTYIKSVIFWLLIGIYLFTILFNVFLLHWLKNQSDLFNIKLLNISILLTMLCFMLLIPYFLFTMKQLRPKNIISKALMQVDKKFIKILLQKKYDVDHIQLVSDIIQKSLKSNDPITRFGVSKLSECYDRLIYKENDCWYLFDIDHVAQLEDNLNKGDLSDNLKREFETKKFPLSENPELRKEKDNKWKITTEDEMIYIIKKKDGKLNIYNYGSISAYFRKHFLKIVDAAIKNTNTDTIEQIVDIFVDMVKHPESKEMASTADQTIDAFHKILMKVANRKFSDVSEYAVKKFVGVLVSYLFSWDNIPGKDDGKLRKFLKVDVGIEWVENAEIYKSNDGKTIRISKDQHQSEIILDETKEKAALIISDGRTFDLKVKNEDGKLNIYKDPKKLKKAKPKLLQLGLHVSKQEKLEATTLYVIEGLSVFAEELYMVGLSASQHNQRDATRKAVKKLTDLADKIGSIEISLEATNKAFALILKATNLGFEGYEEELHNLGSTVIKNKQLDATKKIIRELINLSKKFSSNPKKAFNASIKAIDLILKATENKMKIHSVCNELGEYYFGAEKTKTKIDLHSLGDGEWCKFTILDDKPKKVILEMKSCCIKTIKKLDDEKIQDYCRKTLAFNKQAYEEELPPVCTITHSYLTCAIKQIKSYLFSWENIPGNDNERLISFLVDELGIKSAAGAEITKSNGGDTINIANDDYSAEIMMDANKKKAILKVSDVRTHDLIVKTEKSTLNIYKQTNVELERPIERNENGCPRLTFRVTTYLPP